MSELARHGSDSAAAASEPRGDRKPTRWTTFKRLFEFCRPQHLRIFTGLSSLTLNSVTNLYFPWMMGQVLDDASSQLAVEALWRFLGQSLGVIALGSIASWVRVYCLQSSGRLISGSMKEQLFDSYIQKDIHYFDEAGIGEMVTVMDKDVEKASSAITENLPAGVRSFNSAINGSALLFKTSPQLCGIALSMTPVFGILAMFIRKKTKLLAEKLRELQSESLNFVTERFGNVSTIRLNGRESTETARYSKYTNDSYAISTSSHATEGAFMGFLNMSTNVSLLIILFAGGRMINRGQMTAGSLTRFAMQSAFVGLGFSGLSAFYSDLGLSLDAAARVFEVIDKNRAEKEASLSTGGDLKNQYAQVGNNVDMGIDIKSLSFSYPSQPSRIVLDGISLSVRPRELVAFVGKSGSGKSTLLSIISGLYNCKKGEVVVGGCDLSASKDMLINEQIGVVEQSSGLFSGTVLENICYGKHNASFDDAMRAAEAANADEFINRLPEKYDTQIGCGGGRLSGGQQARLALARALVKDPSVLLLDEPSAALDSESELFLMDALIGLKKTKTIVVCTHSDRLMKLADKIYIVHDGKITGAGTYAELGDSMKTISDDLVE